MQKISETRKLAIGSITQSLMNVGLFMKECKENAAKLCVIQQMADCKHLMEWMKGYKGMLITFTAISTGGCVMCYFSYCMCYQSLMLDLSQIMT